MMDQNINIAYGVGQQKRTTQPINVENIYEDLNTTEGGKSGEEKSKATLLLGRCLVGIVAVAAVLVLALAAVLALALAVGAIVLVVTNNSNQEIQSLHLEIQNLREMLNQTTMMIEELGNQITTLQTNTRTQNSECIHKCRN